MQNKAFSTELKFMPYTERLQFKTVKTIHKNYNGYQSHATFIGERLDGKLSFVRCQSSPPPVPSPISRMFDFDLDNKL